jgi:lysozyme
LIYTEEMTIARRMIREHEGVRRLPYEDTLGVLTVGVGRNLERGLSDDEIEYLFQNDLREALRTAETYSHWRTLNTNRRAAILDMAFQLGAARLSTFVKMHDALERRDYDAAADECLDSRYAEQVPARARKISEMLRNG